MGDMFIDDTTQFTLNVGIHPGYFHDNKLFGSQDVVDFVSRLWQKKAEETFKVNGVYVGAVVQNAKTVYRPEWGCPEGGEETVVISGLRNPEFQKNDDVWRVAVSMTALKVGAALQQTTAYLTFSTVTFMYLKPGNQDGQPDQPTVGDGGGLPRQPVQRSSEA